LIYRDYLASPEIKEKLQKEDEEQLTENENSLVQYKEPGIFKKIHLLFAVFLLFQGLLNSLYISSLIL